ncbi:hypothetical protein [Chryseobacterium daeguense]|uniref:hypothetical protein n=1 Tax=Chryseobacterium daeguense TaxID=412438 RepID=UPI000400480A|nr:hypothetical protein [Chryseobacterium daeguense]
MNAGTGGSSVGTGGTANTALRLENSGNGQAVIQNLTAKNASGTAVSAAFGINPNFSTNGIFLLTRSNTSDLLMDLGTGNIGINTVPTAKLHVNGTFRLVDGTQANGRILASDANGNAFWKDDPIPNNPAAYITPYVSAAGGTNVAWNNNTGWLNNAEVNVPLNEITDVGNVYDPTTGVVTINTAGAYFVTVGVRLRNDPAATPGFDGSSGNLLGYLMVKPSASATFNPIASQGVNIIRGLSNPGGLIIYDASVESIMLLNPSDQLKLNFRTYGTANMNNDPANVVLDKSGSYLRVYKF